MRFDLIFSYWIFIWFILYLLNIVKISPKLLLIIGLIENIFLLISMIVLKTNIYSIIGFIIINLTIKVVPIYILREETIQFDELIYSFFVFIVYLFWLFINRQNLTGNYKKIYNSIIYGKNKTPFLYYWREFIDIINIKH